MRSRRWLHIAATERAKGIEPSFSAWEADVLPLNYAREEASHYRAAPWSFPTGRSAKSSMPSGSSSTRWASDCIQPSSVDLHVDRYFRLFRNHSMRVIDVREDLEDLTELVEIADGEALILHPGEFILGSTLERVGSPTTWWPGWRASPRSGAWGCSSTPRPGSWTPAGTGTSPWSSRTWPTCPSPSTRA